MTRLYLGLIAAAAFAAAAPIGPAAATDMTTVRTACAALGLNPSEAPFAYCVQSLEASAPSEASAAAPAAATAISGRYTAEDACVAIGLNPATARFSYCVSNLKQTLFDSQNVLAR